MNKNVSRKCSVDKGVSRKCSVLLDAGMDKQRVLLRRRVAEMKWSGRKSGICERAAAERKESGCGRRWCQ